MSIGWPVCVRLFMCFFRQFLLIQLGFCNFETWILVKNAADAWFFFLFFFFISSVCIHTSVISMHLSAHDHYNCFFFSLFIHLAINFYFGWFFDVNVLLNKKKLKRKKSARALTDNFNLQNNVHGIVASRKREKNSSFRTWNVCDLIQWNAQK